MYPSIYTIDGRKWSRQINKKGEEQLFQKAAIRKNDEKISADLREVVIFCPENRPTSEGNKNKNRNSKTHVPLVSEEKKRDPTASQDEGKEKEKEAIIAGLVRLIGEMMNRRQMAMSVISIVFGAYCTFISEYRDRSQLNYEAKHADAYALMSILFIYGTTQLAMGITFFITCSLTTMAIRKGKKWGAQIVIALIGTFFYLCVMLATLAVGVVGFYKVMQMYSRVDYNDPKSEHYVDQLLYRSSLFLFTFHICFSITKCCCCR